MKNSSSAIKILNDYELEDLPEFVGLGNIDVNTRGNFGNFPLHIACIRGLESEVVGLIDGGATLDSRGEFGNTPMHEAVGQDHIQIVKILLDAGAKQLEKNDWGQTPIDIARQLGLYNIELLLSSYP